MTRPALLGIRHVALYVADLAAAERFWTNVMGYAVEWRPDPDNVYLVGGRDNLALHRGEPGGGGRLDHIGLAVPAPADVDAWAAHLAAHGVAVEKPPKTHRDGSRSLYLRGPEQLLIQIIHHSPMVE
jgi:catechol 2,3-dioxygenase-like lactoylglutathione lyase family enzyme